MKKKILSLVIALSMALGAAAALPQGAFTDSASISASAAKSGDYEYTVLSNKTVEITSYNGKATKLSIPSTIAGKKVTSIGNKAFYYSSLVSVVIPDTITSIGKQAFFNSSGLTSITIAKSVKTIESEAFAGTKWLENHQKTNPLVIVNGIVLDGIGCTGIVNIPNGVTTIVDYAFSYIFAGSDLTGLNIPESVTSIGQWSFASCTNLKSVTIPRGVKFIGEKAFGYVDNSFFDDNGVYNVRINRIENFKIYCYKGTAGEEYAKNNGFDYELLGEGFTRISGANRFATAAEISKASFKTADTVVLAYGLNYADALAGVTLANKLNAPILLTYTAKLPDETQAEIKRLGAKKVIILGGTGAISKDVEESLKKNGLTTERYAGTTRFGTATAIAEKLNDKPTDVFFVYAFNYADALSVSTVAALKNAPIIYLKTNGELDDDTAKYLAKLKKAGSVKNAYVIGGEGVISKDMLNKAGKALGVTPTRVAGKNRYATCTEVNNKFKSVLTGSSVCVAKGLDFPDALAGGVFAAKQKAPLFLADNTLKDEQKTYLKSKKANTFYVFGGTGAVPDKLVSEITTASK